MDRACGVFAMRPRANCKKNSTEQEHHHDRETLRPAQLVDSPCGTQQPVVIAELL
jgi:hypothetical protein